MSEDPELEAFLRKFRPAAPPPLARRRAPASPWLAGFAAAAAIGLIWLLAPFVERRPDPVSAPVLRPTVGVLNAALRAGRYEDALDRLSEQVLPDPLRAGSALRIIGDPQRDR